MQVIHINPENPEQEKISLLADSLKSGSVIVFPTDTVPGLIADASNSEAVEKIFEIKRRSTEKKFPIFVSNIEIARQLCDISEDDKKELKAHWPGAFTYILNRIPYQRELYGVDEKSLALRIPNYKPLNMLLDRVGIPLVQTSVNASGTPPLTSIEQILEYLEKQENQPDIIVDTGKTDHGNPSQIIDLTSPEKKTIRN